MQPDLVIAAGQDKRSVPPRTQRLHDAGYISKLRVIHYGTRTSWMILKRFANEVDAQVAQQGIHFATKKIRKRLNHSELDAQEEVVQDDMRVKRSIIHDALELLCEAEVLDWHVFKVRLVSTRHCWLAKVLTID